jgi:hypothetical protein
VTVSPAFDSQYGPSENVSTRNRFDASQMAYPTADCEGTPVKENKNPPFVALPDADMVAEPADVNGMHHAVVFKPALATPLPPAVMFVMLVSVMVAVKVSADWISEAVMLPGAEALNPPERILISPAFVMM